MQSDSERFFQNKTITMERYRSGHNGADSKCVELCGNHVAENLDFMQFSKPSEFE